MGTSGTLSWDLCTSFRHTFVGFLHYTPSWDFSWNLSWGAPAGPLRLSWALSRVVGPLVGTLVGSNFGVCMLCACLNLSGAFHGRALRVPEVSLAQPKRTHSEPRVTRIPFMRCPGQFRTLIGEAKTHTQSLVHHQS